MNYEMSERDSDWHGPMSDPNTGGNRKCCHVCRTEDGVGCKGLWYGVENRQCPCHRTTSTLEQIQEEQRETFNQIPMILGVGEANRMIVNNFISETARIAYEAGQQDKSREICLKWPLTLIDAEKHGFRAGLERAKALVPEALGPNFCGKCNLNGPLCEGCYANRQVNKALDDMLSALDTEIAKNTPPQLSERDADWGGLPDENSRATSDL